MSSSASIEVKSAKTKWLSVFKEAVLGSPQDFTASLASLLELPADSAQTYSARSPWKSDGVTQNSRISTREQHAFHLQPFQVLTLELVPSK